MNCQRLAKIGMNSPKFSQLMADIWLISAKETHIFKNHGETIVNFANNIEFGAMQKCANLVDLKKMLHNETLVVLTGFDTAEKEPKTTFLCFHIPQFLHTYQRPFLKAYSSKLLWEYNCSSVLDGDEDCTL